MVLSPADWQRRFNQQARWTEEVRRFVYRQIAVSAAQRVLEVGCGSGAITGGLHRATTAHIYGVDINLEYLDLARRSALPTRYCGGDALRLPFAAGSFDVCLCHFLLLWLSDPLAALIEMRRVTRRGGFIAALAEPDYGGRIDYPPELERLGRLQAQSLQAQGADAHCGRRLGAFFSRAGLSDFQIGLPGGHWHVNADADERTLEWAVLRHDLTGYCRAAELDELERIDATARTRGERVLFVPTFYAWGRV